jgi:hypothetical protein
VFISLFALDVWGTGAGFWAELAGFLVHLLPVYLILAALVIGWRRPRLGGVLFLLLATGFGLFFGWNEPATLLLLALPPTVTGLLFIADDCVERPELRPRL